MNITEEIFEIGNCTEILANDIKIDTTDLFMLYVSISERISVSSTSCNHRQTCRFSLSTKNYD